GQFSGWSPIGAEATASGYEVAWKSSSGSYTAWNTDSNGNFVSGTLGIVSGTSLPLETIETSFQQDLNGDGMIGSPTIAAGATCEVVSACARDVLFSASTGTLKLDQASSFSGTVAGMSGQDSVDFANISFATVQQASYTGTSSGGILNLTDGVHSANMAMLGDYLNSAFVTSNDGHGGTALVVSPN
ncbi:MAG: hypothetical protein WCB49_08215, partial [Gammaproteobacteria bacterium]